jgi:sensor c-di-GMP phosphodiesterase-like protein
MDDFGTGYSSLAYLTQLPLDQLKIDQSFVRNIGIKPNNAVIAQTIIGMGNSLGVRVIAEGVKQKLNALSWKIMVVRFIRVICLVSQWQLNNLKKC